MGVGVDVDVVVACGCGCGCGCGFVWWRVSLGADVVVGSGCTFTVYLWVLDILLQFFKYICNVGLYVYGVATISRLLKTTGLFCKKPCTRDDILQKRHIILRSLLIVVTPYRTQISKNTC